MVGPLDQNQYCLRVCTFQTSCAHAACTHAKVGHVCKDTRVRERAHTRARAPTHAHTHTQNLVHSSGSYLQTCPSCRTCRTVWKPHMHTVQHLRGAAAPPGVAGGAEVV